MNLVKDRLGQADLSLPLIASKNEIQSLMAATLISECRHRMELLRKHTDFFLAFPNRRFSQRFALLLMPAWQGEPAVHEASVRAPQQAQLPTSA